MSPERRTGRRRAFLGLGSNLGDRRGHLRSALEQIGDLVAVSPCYETEPLGGPAGQGPYLNVVAELETGATPRELLGLARALEDAAGRERGVRWGPRTLDVDVLLVGEEEVDEADLVVPHPRMWERRFVLAPLSDLAPELLPAGWQRRAAGHARSAGSVWPDDTGRGGDPTVATDPA
ncbi:MAG: 2-amino-4-hydroxy-6-hydroxymethyldihydropteridine diphosphokinase [Acidimicrobiales bacterium]